MNRDCFEYSDTDRYGASIYASSAIARMNLTSTVRCADAVNLNPFDAIYFDRSDIISKNCNSSFNTNSESAGFQGNNNSNYRVSYLLCSDGTGRCSMEVTRQSIDAFIDHVVFVNNTVITKGIFYLYSTLNFYLDNVIMTGNIGNGFDGSNVIFSNCYYYSDYPLGIAGETPGVTFLKSPTISWMNEFFQSQDCRHQVKLSESLFLKTLNNFWILFASFYLIFA